MLGAVSRALARLFHETRGGIALTFAIAAPALLCVVGVAVDVANMSFMKSRLQSLADAAALAGAHQLTLPNTTQAQVDAVVARTIEFSAKENGSTITQVVKTDFQTSEVTLDIEQPWTPFFVHFLDGNATPVRAHAKARLLYGTTKICVLTLSPNDAKAVHLDKDAILTANDCGVYSNSTHTTSIQVDKVSKIRAKLNCAAGGVTVAKQGSILAEPITDCPPLEDPLKNRPPPDFSGCDFTDFKVVSGSTTLVPGVYCGGLEISGNANVQLSSGTYVIEDGPFRVQNEAKVVGDDVGFYLTGKAALIDFSGNSTIRLSGPESGDMAGLLFFEDRSAKLGSMHRINSSGADKLVGTIYLPRGQLLVDPNATVAAESAYTAIITYELSLTEAPNLVLNSNYNATDVPIPAGIKTSGTVVLAE
jgi:Flp pilus assembly protein TadG